MLKTALITDRHYLEHAPGRGHPERPERVKVLLDMAAGLDRAGLARIAPREATVAEIELCHEPRYVSLVRQTATRDSYDFDPDTHASRATYHTSLLAAGGVLTAVEAVLGGEADNGFALVRPPGHHALPDRAMGFCFFNNVAIAARYLTEVKGLGRVMILDWDVHHGNGTQDIFYDSPRVLYCSLHQFPHYPGTGSAREIGDGEGRGYTVNLPMPATFGDAEYLAAFDRVIMPIGRQFRPDFILVSAGFDCHFRDPLADMRVTEAGFAAMARRLKRLAAECCGGRMALTLEGGYDLGALASSVREVIEELGCEADERIDSAPADRIGWLLDKVCKELAPFWKLEGEKIESRK
ncbi:MAG TPA: histone deacetylase [Candidatus Binataceae bacterium]|jgi:acetoin utilization deacetylase AcuC-like enzyme|nr:histone deacetylase [Candidatus Binataceae bacterium]